MTKISNQYSLTNILTADLVNSRLGINNVSPAYSLDLTGTFRNTTTSYLSTSTGIASIANTSPTSLWQGQFLQVSSDLILGKLTVNGYSYLGHNVAFNGSAFKSINGGSGALIGFSGVGGFNIDFASGAAAAGDTYPTYSTKFAVTTAGNVGIGTSSPVGEGSDDIVTHIHNTATSGASRAMIRLTNGYTGSTWGNGSFITVDSAQGLYIGNSEAAPMILFTSGAERMRITSGGQLLIGMSSAVSFRSDSQLQVNNCTILRSNDGYNGNPSAVIYSGNDQSGTMFVEFTSSGFSRIGSITRNGASNVSYNTGSDIRIKKNIIDAPTSLNKLNSIQVRSFDWVEDDAHQDFGFIAQELINVMPIAVTKGAKEKDIWQVDNSKLVPLLVKSIQELSAKVSLLENK